LEPLLARIEELGSAAAVVGRTSGVRETVLMGRGSEDGDVTDVWLSDAESESVEDAAA
jgi:hypothetical protein